MDVYARTKVARQARLKATLLERGYVNSSELLINERVFVSKARFRYISYN